VTSAGRDDARRTLVAATNNDGKLREFRRLLAAHPWRVVGLAEAGWSGHLDEPGDTYV